MRIWIAITASISAVCLVALTALYSLVTVREIRLELRAADRVEVACSGMNSDAGMVENFSSDNLVAAAQAASMDARWVPLFEGLVAVQSYVYFEEAKDALSVDALGNVFAQRDGDLLPRMTVVRATCQEYD